MTLTKDQLTVLYAAIVTPLTQDGTVDVTALQKVVRFQLDASPSGIVPTRCSRPARRWPRR